jgi:putative hemolysin
MLWKGIADYAQQRGARYLLGCSSITSQEPAVGASAYSELCRKNLASPQWRTRPLPEYDCPLDRLAGEEVKIPKLLRVYLTSARKSACRRRWTGVSRRLIFSQRWIWKNCRHSRASDFWVDRQTIAFETRA